MGKNEMLHYCVPDVRTEFMAGENTAEKVRYLQFPHISCSDAEEDVAAGAVHMKDTVRFIKSGAAGARVKIIINETDEPENTLLAIGYIEGCRMADSCDEPDEPDEGIDPAEPDLKDIFGDTLNDLNELYVEDTDVSTDCEDEDQNDPGCYEELEDRALMLNAGDIYTYTNGSISYGSGGSYMQVENGNVHHHKPYWADATSECVIISAAAYSSESIKMALSYFSENRSVYLIFDNFQKNNDLMSVFNEPAHMPKEDDINIRNITLDYMAETITVTKLSVEEKSIYYKSALACILASNHVICSDDVPYSRIIDCVMHGMEEQPCSRLDTIVKYAIRDKIATGSDGSDNKFFHLTAEDFAFIDRMYKNSVSENGGRLANEKLQEDIVGLKNVKDQIGRAVTMLEYQKRCREAGLMTEKVHNVFMMLGAPGTAKTTMAKLMMQMMTEKSLLPGNRFTSVTGAQLKGLFVGWSAPHVHEIFEKNDCIFIDEAYSIASGNNGNIDSFSQEALAQLAIELEENSSDKLVIFAGYGGKDVSCRNSMMQNFLNANPGIRSRIRSTIYFEAYSTDEMISIFHKQAGLAGYKLSHAADDILRDYFAERRGDENFGNGREARALLESAVEFAAARVMAQAGDNKDNTPESRQKFRKLFGTLTKKDVASAVASSREGIYAQVKTSGFAAGF